MFNEYEDILTVPEVSELLCVGKNRVYSLLESGQLKGFRIGRIWKIPKESVELFVRENAKLSTPLD